MHESSRVGWIWAAALCGLMMVLAPETGRGQTGISPDSLFSTITVTDISGYPEIVLFTTLQDADGRNIEVCGAEAFSLRSYHTDLGALRDVTDLEVTLLPTLPGTAISVVLVMDTSGSLRGSGLEQSKAAAREFVNALQPQDRAAIVSFDDDVRLLQPFTNDHSLLNAAIDQQWADGQTSLYDGVLEGLSEASREPGNRNVIVFSDGRENDSVARQTDVITEARRLLIPVHTIAVGSIKEKELRDIAQGTNGTFRKGELGQLGELYVELTNQIRSQYRLVFTSPHGAADYLHRELQLHVQCAGLDTYANTGYVATPPLRLSPTTATRQLIETNQSVIAGADVALSLNVSGNPSEVRLLYRQVGTDTFRELAMAFTGGTTYEATIPGADVSGPGVDCFFIVTNAEGSARSFPTAALEPAIRGPQILVGTNTRPSVSVDTPPIGLTPGESVEVTAMVSGHGTSITEVLLFSRSVGSREYRSVQMTRIGGEAFSAEIPAELVQEDGIELAIIATSSEGLRGSYGQLHEPVVWTATLADVPAGLPVAGCGPTCGMGVQGMLLLSIALLVPFRKRLRSRLVRQQAPRSVEHQSFRH